MERMGNNARLVKYLFVSLMATDVMLILLSLWFALTDSGTAFDTIVTLAFVFLVAFTGFAVMIISRRVRGY